MSSIADVAMSSRPADHIYTRGPGMSLEPLRATVVRPWQGSTLNSTDEAMRFFVLFKTVPPLSSTMLGDSKDDMSRRVPGTSVCWGVGELSLAQNSR